METEVRRFVCEDDDGNTYTVVEYQRIIGIPQLSGRAERAGGVVRLALLNGGNVDSLDDGTFIIVANRKTLRKV